MLENHASWGKMARTPFSGTMERATDLLEIIHTDVCGLMSVDARGGRSEEHTSELQSRE